MAQSYMQFLDLLPFNNQGLEGHWWGTTCSLGLRMRMSLDGNPWAGP